MTRNPAECCVTHGFDASADQRHEREKNGIIVNVASLTAFQPAPYMAVYAATKAYVLSFAEALWAVNQ
ncbi:SDR family NAD(P)-dependent oxidoreductase [Bacillus sonorensis]|nr:SDR family NAD(P)-dependent oxidoreductase [Bacillus sonorensis]